MRRFSAVVWMSWPLWFACEKQEQSIDGVTSESSSGLRNSTGISQSRRSHESAQLHQNKSAEEEIDAVVRKIWDSIAADPASAWSSVEAQTLPEDQRRSLLAQCTTIFTLQDRDAAIHWAENATMGEEREFAISRIAVAWAASDPKAAAEFLRAKGIAGHDDEVAAVQILQLWAQRSGPEASTWAFSLPSESLRQSGLVAVSEQWLIHDAAGCGEWLSRQEPGSLHDAVVAATTEVLYRQIPEIRQKYLQRWPTELRQLVTKPSDPTTR